MRVSQTLKHWGALMRLGLVASLLCLCTVSLCLADPAKAAIRKDLNVPPESLSPALQQVATTYELQVLYPTQVAKDLKTHGAVGFFTPDDALKAVLSGTGLSYKYLDANTVTVFATAAPAGATSAADQDQTNNTQDNSKEAGKKSSQDFLLAQATPGQTSSNVSVDKQDEQTSKKKKAEVLQEVIVTGSRIPTAAGGGAQDVKIYTKEKIDQSGQTTMADFLNTLPEVSVAINENGLQTAFGSTTVQLHGLPVGTTLVLINGRRVEPSGVQTSYGSQFFDLNNIPLAVVDRVEVLSEGSSAIYGSDAIAGVVNIVLNKHIDGFSASEKYGWASGTDDATTTAAWGDQWERASFSVVGTFQTRSELEGFERSITANNNYTPFGGIDARSFECHPGNVFTIDGSNLPGVGAPFAAVPTGYTGTPTQGEFSGTAGTLNKCSNEGYYSFIPRTNRESILGQGNYQLTGGVELFTEILFSHVQEYQQTPPPGLFALPAFSYAQYTVAPSNPYNPFGETVGISDLLSSLGRGGLFLDTDFFRPLVGARGDLRGGWKWEVAAWESQDWSYVTDHNYPNSAAIQTALDSSVPATALNPFTAGAQGSQQLLQSLVYNEEEKYLSRTAAANGFIRGPLLQLPSGNIDLVVGGEYSRDTLYGDLINSPFDPPNTQSTFHRNSYGVFGEARVPIVGNQSGNGDTLALTLAGRYDSYSDFGNKITPQYGAEWRPITSLLFRASYGKAFKAPSLYDLYTPVISFPTQVGDPQRGGSFDNIIETYGGNAHLHPETGQSRTFGLAYSNNELGGLQLSITHWAIDESDSIQALAPQTIVDNESLFPSNVIRASSCQGGPPCPIVQVNDTFVNFGAIDVRGLDYQLKFKFQTPLGELSPILSATQTYRYQASLVPGSPPTDRTSIAYDDGNFAPRWKGTSSVGWKLGAYVGSVTGRYVGKYQDYDSTRIIGNQWFCDANVRIAIGDALSASNPWLRRSFFSLGAVNLFNRLPQYSNFNGGTAGFSPAEADIRGRFLYAQISVGL